MPVTSEGVSYPDASWSTGLVAAFANMASSINTILLRLQGRSYRWADSAARTAQAGMTIDSRGYQIDTDTGYRYDGTTWKIWSKARTAVAPVISNWASSSAKTEASFYTISDGVVHYWGYSQLNGTATVGVMGLSLPVTGVTAGLNPAANAAPALAGNCTFQDASAGTGGRFYGWMNCTDGLTATFRVPSSGVFANTSSTVPLPWATLDSAAWDIFYEAA